MPLNELLVREFDREMSATEKPWNMYLQHSGTGSHTRNPGRWDGWQAT
jgi:hypothetical protein